MIARSRRLPSALILLALAVPALAQYPDPTIITRPGDWLSPDPRRRLNPFNPLNGESSEARARASREKRARALLTVEEALAAVPADAAVRIAQARADVAAAGPRALPEDADPAEAMRSAEDAFALVRARSAAMARERRIWNDELRLFSRGLRSGDAGLRREAARRVVGAAELLRRLDAFDADAVAARGRLRGAMARAAFRRLKNLVF